MDNITAFLAASWGNLWTGVQGFVLPAVVFAILALMVKGRAAAVDLRRALPETGLNLKIFTFNTLFVLPGLALAVTGWHGMLRAQGVVVIPPGVWTALGLPATILATLFVGDFVGYWRHRLEHSALLWPAHAVHHSDTEMTWLSLERFHPVNLATTFLIDSTALLLLGLPPYAIIANTLVRQYYGYLIHADLPWTYGPVGRFVVSPAMHRWHHAADPRAHNTNYASLFSIIDRVFGTFRVPGPCDAPLGVTDGLKPTLHAQLLYACRLRAYRRLRRDRSSGA